MVILPFRPSSRTRNSSSASFCVTSDSSMNAHQSGNKSYRSKPCCPPCLVRQETRWMSPAAIFSQIPSWRRLSILRRQACPRKMGSARPASVKLYNIEDTQVLSSSVKLAVHDSPFKMQSQIAETCFHLWKVAVAAATRCLPHNYKLAQLSPTNKPL